MGLGACCTHYVPLPPLDAIAGWQSSRELGHGQCHVGVDNYSPVSSFPISDVVGIVHCIICIHFVGLAVRCKPCSGSSSSCRCIQLHMVVYVHISTAAFM